MITSSIVTYNTNNEDLGNVLKSALKSAIDFIYIVDNSPTNKLRAFIDSNNPNIEYIYGHGNVGYGAAHNIAIRKSIESGAKYHVVINPDISFDDGVIDTLSNYMDNNLNVGQVMPKILYPNGELQYVCKMIPTPFDLIFKRFLPFSITKKSMDRFQLKFTGYNQEMNIPYLSGCFMFFRVEALKSVGLFDERFFMYPEDIDITRRMHEQYKTMFYPYVSVIHAHAAASKTSKKMLWIHISNMIKYFNKWGWIIDKKRSRYNKQLLNELNKK